MPACKKKVFKQFSAGTDLLVKIKQSVWVIWTQNEMLKIG